LFEKILKTIFALGGYDDWVKKYIKKIWQFRNFKRF
jgi:hypothetical protein